MWGNFCPGAGAAGIGAGLGFVLTLLFWGFLIWALFTLFKGMKDGRIGQSQEDSSLRIIKERYAKGEISKEQMEEMKRELERK